MPENMIPEPSVKHFEGPTIEEISEDDLKVLVLGQGVH